MVEKSRKIFSFIGWFGLAAGIIFFFLIRFLNQSDEEQAVKSVVENLGLKLKNVSLLSASAAEEIERNYKEFLAPALLAEWQADPSKALGRFTSSPWPDRIKINEIKKIDNDYSVSGYIIEITSVEETEGGAAARRFITATLKKIERKWLIAEVSVENYEIVSELAFGNDKVEEAITGYLLSQSFFNPKNDISEEGRSFCSVEKFDPENELFPLYLWAYCAKYNVVDGELKEIGGISIPVKINYPNELSFYDLSRFSYEVPGDGAQYSDDVRNIFPENLVERVFDFDRTRIIQKNEFAALNYFSSGEAGENNLWEAVKTAVKNCEVKSIMQTHSKWVKATLKNGKEILAVETVIDEIFSVAETAEPVCGAILMGTE